MGFFVVIVILAPDTLASAAFIATRPTAICGPYLREIAGARLADRFLYAEHGRFCIGQISYPGSIRSQEILGHFSNKIFANEPGDRAICVEKHQQPLRVSREEESDRSSKPYKIIYIAAVDQLRTRRDSFDSSYSKYKRICAFGRDVPQTPASVIFVLQQQVTVVWIEYRVRLRMRINHAAGDVLGRSTE